jgi:hypothetical protein
MSHVMSRVGPSRVGVWFHPVHHVGQIWRHSGRVKNSRSRYLISLIQAQKYIIKCCTFFCGKILIVAKDKQDNMIPSFKDNYNRLAVITILSPEIIQRKSKVFKPNDTGSPKYNNMQYPTQLISNLIFSQLKTSSWNYLTYLHYKMPFAPRTFPGTRK